MANWLSDNWLILAVAAYGAVSECMPFMKRINSNGVLHFVYLFIGKLLGGKK